MASKLDVGAIGVNPAASGSGEVTIDSASDYEAKVVFAEGGSNKWAIGNDGDGDDAFVVGTGGNFSAPKVTISSAGLATFSNGIAFQSATTGAGTGTGYTLDAYEEGTWTAVLKEGSTAITLSQATMVYVRVGKIVTVGGYIVVDDASIGSGGLSLEGLPFAMDNTISAGNNWGNFSIQDQYDDGFDSGGAPVVVHSNYLESKLFFTKNAYAGAGRVIVYGSEIQNSQQMRLSGTYIAA